MSHDCRHISEATHPKRQAATAVACALNGEQTCRPPIGLQCGASTQPAGERSSSIELQLTQLGPARIRLTLVHVLRAGLVQIGSAGRAQARTVLAADDLGRQR